VSDDDGEEWYEYGSWYGAVHNSQLHLLAAADAAA
jgi:hypothetical protein